MGSKLACFTTTPQLNYATLTHYIRLDLECLTATNALAYFAIERADMHALDHLTWV
jgi:hypothetical protein